MCTSCFSNWGFKQASHCLHCQMKASYSSYKLVSSRFILRLDNGLEMCFPPSPSFEFNATFSTRGLSPSLLLHFYQMCFARWNIISEEGTCDHLCQSKGMSAVSNSNSLIDQKQNKTKHLTVTRMVSGHLSVRTVEKVIFSATFKQVFFTNQKGSENVSLKLSPNYF